MTNGTHISAASSLTEVQEIETHIHSFEHWLLKLDTPGGNKVATTDPTSTVSGVFQLDAGNDAYGSWVQILDSSDTPIITGNLFFDLHRVFITANERTSFYIVQIGFGATGAAALSANTVTSFPFQAASASVDGGPVEIQGERQSIGTKAWARAHCPGQNTATISLIFGLHEYTE